jgi:hypothetical protein
MSFNYLRITDIRDKRGNMVTMTQKRRIKDLQKRNLRIIRRLFKRVVNNLGMIC